MISNLLVQPKFKIVVVHPLRHLNCDIKCLHKSCPKPFDIQSPTYCPNDKYLQQHLKHECSWFQITLAPLWSHEMSRITWRRVVASIPYKSNVHAHTLCHHWLILENHIKVLDCLSIYKGKRPRSKKTIQKPLSDFNFDRMSKLCLTVTPLCLKKPNHPGIEQLDVWAKINPHHFIGG